jgi:DNA-binding CsgD family transcriptional regulator
VTFLQGAHLLLVHADPRGIDLLDTARHGFKAAGRQFRGDEAMAELIEALAAAFTGTRKQALQITQRCLDHALAACAPWAASWARLVRGMALMWHDAPDKAIVLERDTLRWGRSVCDRWGTVWALHAMAWALAEQLVDTDRPTESARRIAYLLGGADRLRQRTGVALPGLRPFAEATAKASTAAQAVLNADTYTAAYEPGLAAEPDAVLAIAVGEPRDLGRRSSQPRPPEPWDVLTPAEQQVAQLAAEGLSNPQIAVRRGVSLRTVETQMTSILRGLAISTRHEISGMIPSAAQSEEPQAGP